MGWQLSPNYKYICTYSVDRMILYEDVNEKCRVSLDKGVIMENLNSKISFSPNSRFISCGLQFNKKRPTVDIFDLNLNSVFSLVGHVAPSEITNFCPKIFELAAEQRIDGGDPRYSILVVASQDLSISIWSTASPVPFVLIKNFTKSPVLDMFWDDLDLYVCSYDGLVKRIRFSQKELGVEVSDIEKEYDFEIPFSIKNIELQAKTLTLETDFNEKLVPLKLAELTVEDINVDDYVVQKLSDDKVYNDKNKSLETKVHTERPKRIEPVILNSKNSISVKMQKQANCVVLFDTNLPEKLKLEIDKPFKSTLSKLDNEYSIELDGSVSIYRCKKLFYEIKGPVKKVCYNSKFLIIYTNYIQIYNIQTGCLLLPYIDIKLSYMDLLKNKLLLLDCLGYFTVLTIPDFLNHPNAKYSKSITGKLPKTKNLTKIELSNTYFILAEYNNQEILFYSKSLKIWLSANPGFNSITSNGIDFFNDNDETLAELEMAFEHYRFVGDVANMNIVAKSIIYLIRKIKFLDDFVEYKIEHVLNYLNDEQRMVLLKEINKDLIFQKFADKMCKIFNL